MKILAIHPGHTFSTSDVYDGLCAGMRACGAQVVPFQWSKMLQIVGTLVAGAAAGGVVKPEQMDHAQQFAFFLAAADAVSVAVDEEVDAVFVVNGLLFPPERATLLQKLRIPVACYGTESPYFDDTELQIATAYTHWYTQERTSVERFRAVVDGGRAFYLPMAFNPELHAPGPRQRDKAADVVFVGGGYPERQRLLDGVDWTGIRHVRQGTLWHLDLEAEHGARGMGRAVRYAEGSIPNSETTHWHRSAAISLNLHRRMTYVEHLERQVAPGAAESLGPRAYEIPAVGGFMLSDDERPELRDVYGESAATFRAWDSADLERQIRYWLAHPDERERRAAAQRAAVLPHTWTARARVVLETLFA